jgi:hypothetical protein
MGVFGDSAQGLGSEFDRDFYGISGVFQVS